MAIIVEDGTGDNPAANSYVSESDLSTYAADRGVTITGTPAALLIQAMDYVESQSFIGSKEAASQPLQWPRTGVYIDGYYVPPEDLPKELTNGQLATALAIDSGNDPLSTIERAVKKEKVDVIEVEYMDNASSDSINRTINAAMSKIIIGGGSVRVFRG